MECIHRYNALMNNKYKYTPIVIKLLFQMCLNNYLRSNPKPWVYPDQTETGSGSENVFKNIFGLGIKISVWPGLGISYQGIRYFFPRNRLILGWWWNVSVQAECNWVGVGRGHKIRYRFKKIVPGIFTIFGSGPHRGKRLRGIMGSECQKPCPTWL